MAPAYTIVPLGSITNMCGVVLASYARAVPLVGSMRMALCAAFFDFIQSLICAPVLYSLLFLLVELIVSHTTSLPVASFCAVCMASAPYCARTKGQSGLVHSRTTNLPL